DPLDLPSFPTRRSSDLTERCQDVGVDAFELNFSCPHGLPERKMGAAMGENPEIVEEVVGWVMKAAKKPVWAKMTPNVTRITEPRSEEHTSELQSRRDLV